MYTDSITKTEDLKFTTSLEQVITKEFIANILTPEIEKVIFNIPKATIVFWDDGTKTIVKCGENDIFDKEKGLALCMVKKVFGLNKGKYYNIFKKFCNDGN